MGKNIGKNISKNLNGKYDQRPLNHAKKSVADALKTTSKRLIKKKKKKQKQLIHNKLIQKQLQMSMIKKYLKKDIYLQKKYNNFLIILD